MLCSNCGQANDQRLRFCTGCGASLAGAPPQPPPPSHPTPRATPDHHASHRHDYAPAPHARPDAPTTRPSPWKKVLIAAACLVSLGLGVGIAVRQFGGRDATRAGGAGGASSGGAGVAATPTPSLDFDKIYTGTVGGNFNVEMRLRRDGESLSGSFFHRPAREEPGRRFTNDGDNAPGWPARKDSAARVDALVRGSVESGDAFTLEELNEEGRAVGLFKGRIGEGASALEGTWTKPDGGGAQQFTLREATARRAADAYRLVVKQTRRKTKTAETTVSYPHMEGASAAAQGFNARVQRLMNERLANSKNAEGEHSTSFVVAHRSPEFLSVLFNDYSMWPGAAHPSHAWFSLNYDLRNNREVKLPDLFRPGSNYADTVARLCAEEVARQKRRLDMDVGEDQRDAVAEIVSGEATFFPSESGVVIVFNPYEVGSYAEGYYVVRLPYAQLRGVLRTDNYVGALAE